MDSLNHAINLTEQSHAELTLLAAQRHDSLQGSPSDVAKRLAGVMLELAANLRIARHKVAVAFAATERANKSLAASNSPPNADKVFTVVTCEMASPPPHVAPTEGEFGPMGPQTFQPKRESDRPIERQRHPNLG